MGLKLRIFILQLKALWLKSLKIKIETNHKSIKRKSSSPTENLSYKYS